MSDDLGPNDFIDALGDTVTVVALVIVLLLLVPLVVRAVRARRRRAESAEDLAADCRRARDELVAIGEVLRRLDVDVPGIDQGGRDALARALDLYDQADRELAKADTRRRLQRAQVTLGEARAHAEVARRTLSAAP